MTVVEKILKCIAYCKEQNELSNGEILEDLTEEDFREMKIVVETMLGEY